MAAFVQPVPGRLLASEPPLAQRVERICLSATAPPALRRRSFAGDNVRPQFQAAMRPATRRAAVPFSACCAAAAPAATVGDRTYTWRGHRIKYQHAKGSGPAVLCVHGFGAHSGHWRKNMAELSQAGCDVYAIDLIGYGGSDKPAPSDAFRYSMETWAALCLDFARDVIGRPPFIAANSIGCVVALQAAKDAPEALAGLGLLNVSLRLLSVQKAKDLPWIRREGAGLMMKVLSYKPLGGAFFSSLAKPQTVRNVLRQAYARKEAVDDELVEMLLGPAQDPGALDSFLAFITYNTGPIPEELLEAIARHERPPPVFMAHGEEDPWEPLRLARAFEGYEAVQEFRTLPGVGHCPQDEAPEVVNPLILEWLARVHGPAALSGPASPEA
eukprot:tig00000237_g20455.t1